MNKNQEPQVSTSVAMVKVVRTKGRPGASSVIRYLPLFVILKFKDLSRTVLGSFKDFYSLII